MTRPADRLAGARAARDAARRQFDARFHRLRGDPEAQTIGERLVERVAEDARSGLDRAFDIARESKGIAAATAALLALWFLREPLLAWMGEVWDGAGDGTPGEDDETEDLPDAKD